MSSVRATPSRPPPAVGRMGGGGPGLLTPGAPASIDSSTNNNANNIGFSKVYLRRTILDDSKVMYSALCTLYVIHYTLYIMCIAYSTIYNVQ